MRPPLSGMRRQSGSAWGWTLGALVVLVVVAILAATTLHWGAHLQRRPHAYPGSPPKACPDAKLGALGEAERNALPPFTVRAPANYDARYPHPLLIVFSPAGFGAGLTERFTGLTSASTAAGLLVAYVSSRPMSRSLPTTLARLPARIAEQWCLDPRRITFAGHSDGGTLAQVIALVPETQAIGPAPAAVVASAAGLQENDFASLRCPGPVEVLLLHGEDDGHFPGFGESAARGWARCLSCDDDPVPNGDGCLRYPGCSGSLRLCLHPGNHLTWPDAARRRIVGLASAATRP